MVIVTKRTSKLEWERQMVRKHWPKDEEGDDIKTRGTAGWRDTCKASTWTEPKHKEQREGMSVGKRGRSQTKRRLL